jgi:acyl carrier protein
MAPPTTPAVPTAAVAPAAPAPVTTPVSDAVDRSSLTQLLLSLVSERTGYPPEMLGMNQDMEAELGIDSIKRVEILGALQQQLPQPLASSVQQRMENFTSTKSLNGILDQLLTA